MKRKLEAKRTEGSKGLTLAQLSEFVSECGRAGLSPEHVVGCSATFGGRIIPVKPKHQWRHRTKGLLVDAADMFNHHLEERP